MEPFDHMEKETIAEVGNISLGAAAAALSEILNRRVYITAPHFEIRAISQIREEYPVPCLLAEVKYLSGLKGSNVLLIKQDDAVIIAALMMGNSPEQSSLGEMELSAIQEAMNQMMGYMATAMSEMFGRVVEISPPGLTLCNLAEENLISLDESHPVVELSFTIQVEGFIDSRLIQVIPCDFAKKMTGYLLSGGAQPLEGSPGGDEALLAEDGFALPQAAGAVPGTAAGRPPAPGGAGIAPVARGEDADSWRKLDLVREIPLEVTVLLGKTRAPLGELFALDRGGIITLDQASGSAVEIRINNRPVARGEVVLVDHQFGVRITEHLADY